MDNPLLTAGTEENKPRVYSVSEMTRDVRAILEAAFDAVWVEGEISNFRVAASKHAYFVLKDEKAQIRCVLFKNFRAGLKYQPEDGDHVVLFGRVTVYDARGEYQIVVETVEPVGLGALQKAFEQLKEKLAKEGLFAAAHKKPLPEFPWKVGVVTSPTGAAIRDILHVIRRRNPKVSVLINPVKVQGEGSAEEIAGAIHEMNRLNDIDVLIVGRGGGSIEDLWAFNEEVVARAIFASKIPVISAVGHEIDFTIADFVADFRAPTPSAAAEIAVPVLDETVRQWTALTRQLVVSVRRPIQDHQTHLRRLIDRRFFREPLQILAPGAQRLDELNHRLLRGLNQWVTLQRQRLQNRAERLFQASPQKNAQRQKERLQGLNPRLLRGLRKALVFQGQRLKSRTEQLFQLSPKKAFPRLREKRAALEHRLVQRIGTLVRLERKRFEGGLKNLNAFSPLAVLERGYSIATFKGKALKSGQDVKPGDAVQIRLAKGRLDCTVDKILE